MKPIPCLNCQIFFTPRNCKQNYCSDPKCQRARKALWQKEKMAADSEYRKGQRLSQEKWLQNNPDYYENYRQNNPEKTQRNRCLQRIRNQRKREGGSESTTHERCTPGLAAMVSVWSALLSSFEEACQVLCDHGIKLGVKVIQKLAYRYAERARVVQQAGLIPLNETDNLQGRRVVISTDGGRTRLREKKRGPKTKKGRNRYKGAWREPKLLIIYVVDAQGKQEKSFNPFIDGGFNGPDGLFDLLEGYLESLSIQKADKVLFVAYGAHWIWNRVPGLVKSLGLEPEMVYELLDFYHAVEHLGKVAGLRKSWSAKERKSWIAKQRGLLLKGESAMVVQAVQVLCRGRNSKAIKTERDYFVRNEKRLEFSTVKALDLPIGSGAIENSIRRMVNLRLKGPCIFWCRENADKMLMLRSYYKSGRWNYLKKMANSPISLLAA